MGRTICKGVTQISHFDQPSTNPDGFIHCASLVQTWPTRRFPNVVFATFLLYLALLSLSLACALAQSNTFTKAVSCGTTSSTLPNLLLVRSAWSLTTWQTQTEKEFLKCIEFTETFKKWEPARV
ncbi:hypothetical protein L596_021834 [Steinernema carpocapsae]|uniref:Uncharacterized protein n=1 Tax=Steinernema carpocapsae TaxID=34508 RepID=A0A4U5MJZ1_STECR|nr:hypothetical protein L596_021834 [Steinernema carpocapsae]